LNRETIDYKEQNVDINILGLRHLQSFGLLPVKKAFVKFNLKSLLPPEKSKAVQNVKTNPQDTGPNPNINTMISFTINLPANSLYCPKLSCDVYDQVYKGLMQPLLGTFAIPLGEILDDQVNVIESENKQSEFFIKELKKVLNGAEGPGGVEEEIKEEQARPEDVELVKRQSTQLKGMVKKVTGVKGGSKGLGEIMGPGGRGNLKQAKQAMVDESKKELEGQRNKDMESMKQKGESAHSYIVKPKYNFDERLNIQREVDPPPPSIYLALGFNQTPQDDIKHYRRYFPDELENVKDVMPKMPFRDFEIKRGQQRGLSKGFFSMFSKPKTDETGQVSNVKVVGKFKGIVSIYNTTEKENFDSQKNSRLDLIAKLVKDTVKKKTGEEFEFKMEELENAQKRHEFN